jgi:Putative beta-barrel porin-2, OmpL-like. bbp2
MKKTLLHTFFMAGLLVFTEAQAQTQIPTDTALTPLATPEAEATKGDFAISGYVDTYYFYNLNDPKSGLNKGRIFDLPHNTFNLGLVQTMITYTYGKSKVVADLVYGPNADLGNFTNFISPNVGVKTSSSLAIKQAFLSYNLTDKLAFTIGQYGTHIGYELIDAPLNYNYSLSYLFGNGPFYHTGAKVDYALTDKVGLMLGVVNGWDMLGDLNKGKSITAQVHLAPVENLHVYANWIGGDEHNGNSAFGNIGGSYTSLFDLTSTLQATEKFKIGLNAAYGRYSTGAVAVDETNPYSDDATWRGAALYLNYAASEVFSLGVRAERFEDPKGVRYFGAFEGNELTLTGNVKLAGGHLNVKPELRFDTSKNAYFENEVGDLKKSQVTVGAAFVYSFGNKD